MQKDNNDLDTLANATHQPSEQYLDPIVEQPSLEELEDFCDQGGCDATDGCWVEPDGLCEHGHVSWLLYLNLI